MNSSELRKRALKALGEESADGIDRAISFLEQNSIYHHSMKQVPVPDFLQKECYERFLKDCDEVALVCCSLGIPVEREIRRLMHVDMRQAVILDFLAGLFLEMLADDSEASLPGPHTARFCPGYGASPLEDVSEILSILRPGYISLSASNMMQPSKSMAGFIGLGASRNLDCTGCAKGPCSGEETCHILEKPY